MADLQTGPPPQSSMIQIGKIFYDPQLNLGSGSFGEVYQGLHRDGSKEVEVAVKKIKEDARSDTRREVQAMLEFDYHHVIRLFGVEEDPPGTIYQRFMYLAMELCCGTLTDCIKGRLPLKLTDFDQVEYCYVDIKILREITLGLWYVHAKGYVHKDLKADNILVHLNKEGRYTMKLADFGLVRRLDGGLVGPDSSYTGTADHRAPERDWSKSAYGTSALDIFALGIIFFQVLTKGAHPFGTTDQEKLKNIEDGKFSLDPLVDMDRFDAIDLIGKMIAYAPNQRPSTEQIPGHPLLIEHHQKRYFLEEGCPELGESQVQLHPQWVQRLNTWAEDFDAVDAAALEIDLSLYRQSSDPLKCLREARSGPLNHRETFRLFEKNVPCFFFFTYLTRKSLPDRQNSSPLHKAVDFNDVDRVLQLLEEGGQGWINFQDHEGKTPLYLAAEKASASIVELLANRGAQLDIADQDGVTPLHRAVLRGQEDIIETLLQLKASVETGDAQGRTPLHYAAAEGRPRILQLLLDAGAGSLVNLPDLDGGETPLHFAVKGCSVENADLLIKAGANVNAQNEDMETALQFAVGWKNTPSPALISFLLEKGADPYMPCSSGRFPLHVAAMCQDSDILELVLDKTREIDMTSNKGETALYCALKGGLPRNAELLINAGAGVHAFTKDNKTLLHAAVRSERPTEPTVVRFLLAEIGHNPDMPDNRGITPLHLAARDQDSNILKLLLDESQEIDKPDGMGQTALYYALQGRKWENAELLIQRGADVNALNNERETLLHVAISSEFRPNFSILRLLLENGPNPDMPDSRGLTPLHLAARNQFSDTVKLFLTKTKEINKRDLDGKTALDHARDAGKPNNCNVLLKAGAQRSDCS